MPLKKGSSDKTVSSNIKTEMHAYEKTGTLGNNSHPANKKAAQKQAVAIALTKAGKSRKQGGAKQGGTRAKTSKARAK